MAKLIAGLVFVVIIFGGYAAKELLEAHEHGTSPREGYEALVVAAVLLVAFAAVITVKRRHRRS
jgi:hypothetical protein